MALVRPVASVQTYFDCKGGFVHLNRAKYYDTDDDLFKERPDLFEGFGDVEQATAAPGEKRTTKRTTK